MNRYARIALLMVIALLSIGYASALTNNTPTAYYSFNTSLLLDDTGNGNSLTETGTSTQWVTGLAGNASRFFSDNDELQSPVYFNGTNAMSFSAWINPNATNGMVMGQDNGGTYRSWYVYYSSTSKIEFQVTNTAGTNVAATTTATYGTGIGWIHVCGAYDGSNVWLRVNGTTTTNNSASGTLGFGTATSGAIIGNRDQSLPFAGDVDEVAWWVGDAITARDCDDLYNSGFPLTYPFTPASGLDNFTVTAQDAYTASSITGFNVTFEDLGITTTQTSYNHTTDYATANPYAVYGSGIIYNTTKHGYNFYGSGMTMDLLSDNKFDLVNFTLVYELAPSSTTYRMDIISKGESSYITSIDTSGRNNMWIYDGGYRQLVSTTNMLNNQKYWVAFRYNYVNNVYDVWINGVQEASATPQTWSQFLNNSINLSVGSKTVVSSTNLFNGTLYELRIYNTTLNNNELLQVYNGTGDPQKHRKVVHYEFINFSTEPSTFDYSGQGVAFTTSGATYNTSAEAYEFTGSNEYLTNSNVYTDNPFTISTWIQTDMSSNGVLYSESVVGFNRDFFVLRTDASGNIDVQAKETSGASLALIEGNIPINDGNIHHVILVYDGTNLTSYINGTKDDTIAYSNTNVVPTTNSIGLLRYSSNLWSFDGTIHEFSIYPNLSVSDITKLSNNQTPTQSAYFKYTFQNSTVGGVTVNGIPNYFGNTTSNVNTSNTFASKHTRYPEALFYDAYTGLNITSFNVTINATVYTTTNGSLYIPYKDLIGTSSANKYFQASNTISNRTEYLAHYASITGFNAYDKVSGLNISTFTVNTTSEGGTATNNSYLPSLYTTYGNFTAEFNKAGYYQSFTTYEANPQTSQSANFTVFNHKLRVNITTDVGSSSNNTFNITIYSMNYTFTETGETTNGTTSNNLSHGTYMVWINDTLHTLTNQTITLQEGNNITNITIQVQTSNTFNLFFKNESNNELLSSNTTVYLTVIGDVNATNYTFVNNTILIEMLTPDEYEFIYWIDPDVRRSYYITLNEQSFENITLYTIDEDISSFYVPVEVDDKGTRCSNNTVSLLRYYTDINGYRTVEMSRTNTLGQAVLRVVPNIINYKLSFTGSCGDFTTAPTKIIDTTNNYLVAQAQSILYSSQNIGEVLTNITYINSTATYSFTWQDNNNLVTEGCLSVTRRTNGTTKTVHNNCSASSSGSLIYTIPLSDRNNTVFNAKGTIETNSDNNYYYTAQSVDFRNSFAILGATGLWIAILLFSTLVIFSAQSVGTMIITSIIAFAGISWIGIVFSEWTTVIGLAILGAIIIYRSRS